MEVDSSGTGSPNLTKSDKHTLRTILVTVAVIVALGLFGGGAYYFGTRQATKSADTFAESTESGVLGTEQVTPATDSAGVPGPSTTPSATPSSTPTPSSSPVPTLKINIKAPVRIPLPIPTSTPTPVPTLKVIQQINLPLERLNP